METDLTNPTVSFTTNLAAKDSAFAEQMLRHILRTLDYSFCERVVAFDDSPLKGVFQQRQAGGDLEEQSQYLARLLSYGIVDRIETVPWEDECWQLLLCKYYGDKKYRLNEARDWRGAAVYQYLFALDQCVGDYVLHVDSDIFFCCSGEMSWIDEGIALMQKDESVAVVTPGHAPAARNVMEYTFGRPLGRRAENRWFPAETFSTRYFLWDRKRVGEMIPLDRNNREPLEKSLTKALAASGRRRLVLNDPDVWAMHPVPHNENFRAHLSDFIWAAENNVYPFRRRGKCPWNIQMDDEDCVLQWLKAINRARLSGMDGDG